MSTTETHSEPLEQKAREFLERRRECGNSYVKTSMIAEACDTHSRRLTPVVGELVKDGTLEVWKRPSSAPNLYRITEDGAPVDVVSPSNQGETDRPKCSATGGDGSRCQNTCVVSLDVCHLHIEHSDRLADSSGASV